MSMKVNNVHVSQNEEERMPLVPTRCCERVIPDESCVGCGERMNTDEPG